MAVKDDHPENEELRAKAEELRKKLKLVVVVWDDAASDEGDWEAWDDVHLKPVKSFTSGWLLEETKQYVVVCNTLNGLSHTSGRIVIPYKMLHSMTVVGQSNKVLHAR